MSLFEAISPGAINLLKESGALGRMRPGDQGLARPLMLSIETINVCNSECVFCPYTIQTRAKGLMKQSLFEQTVGQYIEMGGGPLSITPVVGDILLDRRLSERIEFLQSVTEYVQPSVTTNLFALHRWSDEVIVNMLHTFRRVHVSCYGITEEECREITKTDYFGEFCRQMRRLHQIARKTGFLERITVGFRLLYNYSADHLGEFQMREFNNVFPLSSATALYCNWGNSMRGSLPGEARYVQDRENRGLCAMLTLGLLVFWDGRVSACNCCDYNASVELSLGNVATDHLENLYNGAINQQLWVRHQEGKLPEICKNCTFHIPLETFSCREEESLLNIVGG